MRDHKKLRAFELADEIVIMMYETGIAIPSHSVKWLWQGPTPKKLILISYRCLLGYLIKRFIIIKPICFSMANQRPALVRQIL
jgi:hypothetical protein